LPPSVGSAFARASCLLVLVILVAALGCAPAPSATSRSNDDSGPARATSTPLAAAEPPTSTPVAPTPVAPSPTPGLPTPTPVEPTPTAVGSGIESIVPNGATLVTLPGAQDPRGIIADLEGGGARDVVALYQDPAEPGGSWLLVAGPDRTGRLRVLWRWNVDGVDPTAPDSFQLALVDFVGAGFPQLFVASRIGAAWEQIRVVSFAGGTANVLLANLGDQPTVLTPPGGGLPGLAFWQHLTGPAGLEEVWQWDRQLGRFVRADGAFPEHYATVIIPRLERDLSLAPSSPYLLYSLAVARLQAGQNDRALTTARQGLASLLTLDKQCPSCSFSSFEPDFREIEATVLRQQGNCEQAIPLYQQVVASRQDFGSAFGWDVIPRAYLGLAICARQQGQIDQMRDYLQRAIDAGKVTSGSTTIPPDQRWYGYADAERLGEDRIGDTAPR
jgi:hypothetical protein